MYNLLFFQGKSSYTRRPPLTTGAYELYDSCVDSVLAPTMYILFEIDQCYPKYLIGYKVIQNDTVKRDYDKGVARMIQSYRGRNYLLSSQLLKN